MALADIRTTFHNLVISRYYTCQLAGRRMLAQGKGSIMSIGSIAGVSSLGRAQSVYSMAMAAVIQMTRELSYLPAHIGGFKDRGAIREQAPADIVVYDLAKLEVLSSEVAEGLPGGEWRRIQKSKGYNWIRVNGEITFEDGKPTGASCGTVAADTRVPMPDPLVGPLRHTTHNADQVVEKPSPRPRGGGEAVCSTSVYGRSLFIQKGLEVKRFCVAQRRAGRASRNGRA